MKKKLTLFGIAAFAAVIVFSMTACASVPEGAEESALTPDASSAVVYFIHPNVKYSSGDIVIWDGENPIGKIKGGLDRNIAYRAEPGTHYFMAKRFNWTNVKVEISADSVYYIQLNWAPNPIPFVNAFVILELLSQQEGQEQFRKTEKTITFTDSWRNAFTGSLSQEELAAMRESLSTAQK